MGLLTLFNVEFLLSLGVNLLCLLVRFLETSTSHHIKKLRLEHVGVTSHALLGYNDRPTMDRPTDENEGS